MDVMEEKKRIGVKKIIIDAYFSRFSFFFSIFIYLFILHSWVLIVIHIVGVNSKPLVF